MPLTKLTPKPMLRIKGIPILESLCSKTPVITSKGGCFSEAGGPNSKYINPLSIEEMKKAILDLQRDGWTKEKIYNTLNSKEYRDCFK